MRPYTGTLNFEYEDSEGTNPLGKCEVLAFELDYNYWPAEREVRYYRDGSGHPGSPAEVEITAVRAIPEEFTVIADWFKDVIDQNSSLFETIREKIIAVMENHEE